MAPNRWVVSRTGRSNSGEGGGVSYGTYAVEDASSASGQICKRESAGSSRRPGLPYSGSHPISTGPLNLDATATGHRAEATDDHWCCSRQRRDPGKRLVSAGPLPSVEQLVLMD